MSASDQLGTGEKQDVYDYWNRESCGEFYARGKSTRERFESHRRKRYTLEPYIWDFAKFDEGHERDVLEVRVGYGSDHIEWAKAGPRRLDGVDLTDTAIENTRRRLAEYGFDSNLQTANAEALPHPDGTFDIVYAWGVIHHSPNTEKATREIHRVLKPGGRARVMIYHKWSLVGLMLWGRYALATGRPLRSLADLYANHLESPGTKAYTKADARRLFGDFDAVSTRIQLSHGDLLAGEVGQRYRGGLLQLAKALWPRRLVKALFPSLGPYPLI